MDFGFGNRTMDAKFSKMDWKLGWLKALCKRVE
jgi:hypothetical protein